MSPQYKPTVFPKSILNHMCSASIKYRFSKTDQEQLQYRVKEWKQESPSDRFYFKPYVKDPENDTSASGSFHPAVEKQIACIMIIGGEKVEVHVQPVQQQTNSVDCGMFAIAFATGILHGEDVTQVRHDVPKMRPHLTNCSDNGTMTLFPKESSPRQIKRVAETTLSFLDS